MIVNDLSQYFCDISVIAGNAGCSCAILLQLLRLVTTKALPCNKMKPNHNFPYLRNPKTKLAVIPWKNIEVRAGTTLPHQSIRPILQQNVLALVNCDATVLDPSWIYCDPRCESNVRQRRKQTSRQLDDDLY